MQWNELTEDCHYTTYHKKFVTWSKVGIFSLTHKLLVENARVNGFISNNDLDILSIDTSMIKNNRGVDEIGANHYDRYRNATKVSVVVSQQGIPLGLSFKGANVHDVKMVFDTINDVQIKIAGSTTLADKGYNSIKLKKDMKEKYKIDLIYPLKKNQKNIRLTDKERSKLKERTVVENYFAWMKSYRRIMLRYEKNVINYASFCYLSASNILCNKLFNMN
jgi:transposase